MANGACVDPSYAMSGRSILRPARTRASGVTRRTVPATSKRGNPLARPSLLRLTTGCGAGNPGSRSTQAAYAAPLILLASNQAAVRDRATLEHAALEAEEADHKDDDLRARLERIEGLLNALSKAGA